MINKKFCVAMSALAVISLTTTGCSQMFSNPMKYVMSQDEARQEQTDSKNNAADNADESSDEHKISDQDIDDNQGIYVLGTDSVSDYSASGMLKVAKEINDDIADDKTKGIILIGEEKYIDYLSYFISLTVGTKKPVVIVKNQNDDMKQSELINQVKSYIKGDTELLPDDCVINKNTSEQFDISDVKSLPDVDIIYDYIGVNTDDLSKKVYTIDGMVLVPSIAGSDISDETYDIVSQKNIGPVVITCSKDILDSKTGSNQAENVYYTDLEPYKARIMLMLLLQNKSDSDVIKRALVQSD